MNALIIGAGRIGRGFVTELLVKNDLNITYFDYDQNLMEEMNKRGTYTIHVLGDEKKNTVVRDYKAYAIVDEAAFCREWETADFIFTAVGGKNLQTVAECIGKAFQNAKDAGQQKKNIVTCENWIEPARKLEAQVLETLTKEEGARFLAEVGVSEAVVMASGVSAPPGTVPENPVDTWVQDFWYLPIDKSRIIGALPNWKYIKFIDDFGNLLQQKLYTNNTSVALIAYLGFLKGHTYVADAANDPEIEEILDKAYQELSLALVHGLQIDKESQRLFSRRAKEKYQNREIIDLLTRIARDPIRKLQPMDRLIGPAKLALGVGVNPSALALAIAAAMYYDDAADADAVKLREMRQKEGVDGILQKICGLEADDELYRLVIKSIDILRDKKWLNV